jgi:hypothetical protein
MPWQQKMFLILFAAWFGAAVADRYRQGGIVAVIFGVILPSAFGLLLGLLVVNWAWCKYVLRIHFIGGIKFLWCKTFHGTRHMERTGNRTVIEQSILYELRCKKCGIIDHEWVTPEWWI